MAAQNGRCGTAGPQMVIGLRKLGRLFCSLEAEHLGWHECLDYEASFPGAPHYPNLVQWYEARAQVRGGEAP